MFRLAIRFQTHTHICKQTHTHTQMHAHKCMHAPSLSAAIVAMTTAKPYHLTGIVAMTTAKPYYLIGIVAMATSKPYYLIGIVAMATSKPYDLTGIVAMTTAKPYYLTVAVCIGTGCTGCRSVTAWPSPLWHACICAALAATISLSGEPFLAGRAPPVQVWPGLYKSAAWALQVC